MKKFINEYRVEILALLVALLGVFLLVEHLAIRVMVRELLTAVMSNAKNWANALADAILFYMNTFTLSDLVGWLLIVGVAAFIVWRVRYRFTHSAHWKASVCPLCGGELHRTHRSLVDHFLSWLLLPNARRYRCKDETCGWSGLRRRRPHQKHPAHESGEISQEQVS